jgi:hypothetical protein
MNDSPAAVLCNDAGDTVGVLQTQIGPTNDRYLGISLTQRVIVSAGNSSAVDLPPGGSFTGTPDVVRGCSAFQVVLLADQPLSLSVEQSPDGFNWDIKDTFNLPADSGQSFAFQLVAPNIRVVVTNVGAVATTALRLTTSFVPAQEALPRSLSPNGTLKLSQQTTSTTPDPANFIATSSQPSLQIDYANQLRTRGPVLTDETSFRASFNENAKYASLAGTSYFRNGSSRVAGIGTSFLVETLIGQYIKLAADADADVGRVLDVFSDTDLILEEGYAGTTGSGTGEIADWTYETGPGATIGVVSEELRVSAGTVSGTIAEVVRPADYLPFSLGFKAKVDQRIAGQELGVGLLDGAPNVVQKQVGVVFSGTDPSLVIFRTSSSSGSVQETSVILPTGILTTAFAQYRVEVSAESASLFVEGLRVATHRDEVPGPYDVLDVRQYTNNLAAPASDTTLFVASIWFQNYNQIQINVSPDVTIPVSLPAPLSSTSSDVPAAVASTLLLLSSADRAGVTVFNDSSAALYLKLGPAASPSSFTVKMQQDDYYEVPFNYVGPIYGYWASATGNARVTEIK